MSRFSVVILLAAFLLQGICTSAQQSEGRQFFKEYWQPRSYLLPSQTVIRDIPDGTGYDVNLLINPTDTLAPILPTHFGVNTTFRNGDTQLQRTSLYTAAGIGSMRFPAGSGSNIYFFDGNIPADFEVDFTPIDGSKSTNMTPELFATFIGDAGSSATIVVNYFYARYGITPEGTRESRVLQAAEYAASFVHKMNVELGAGIKHWEIGNECYGAWETGYNINGSIVSGKEYGEDLRVFADAMKAVDPTIKIGAVVTREDDDWNSTMLPEVKDHADFLVVHNYFTSTASATAENILGSVGQIADIYQTLGDCVEKYTGYPADYYPVAMTEFNSRGPYNCTMVNGLFISQILGELIKAGYGMADLWVSEWNWNETDQESKGFLALNDPDQANYTPRQSYMPFHLASKCVGDHLVSSASDSPDLKIYASLFEAGEIGIYVVNTSSSDKTFNLDITGIGNADNYNVAEWYEFYANSITPGDKRFYLNGLTAETPGGGPEDFQGVAPYKSDVSPSTVYTAKKYSVNYYVLRNEPAMPSGPLNVLLIAVDDLKPLLGSYGSLQVLTPQMDRLAASGLVFTRAYSQWAVCGPSRASLMAGQTPDGTGIRNLTSQLRVESPDLVTLPEQFKNKGYITAACGKVYDPRNVDDSHDIHSWSIPYTNIGDYSYPVEYGPFVDGNSYRVSPNTATETGPEGVDFDGYQDGQICLDALSKLDQFSHDPSTPFFLAVGFKKPHIPFIAPKKYWDLYDSDTLDLEPFQRMATGSPLYAYSDPEPLGYDDIPDLWTYDDIGMGEDILDPDIQRRLLHGYYASVSYIDDLVGMLLDSLEESGLAQNTIVVLYGDHGYHLGDHNQWGKHTLFENALRAPLIIAAPGSETGVYSGQVDFIDIYPTICDLAGISPPAGQMQGISLAPLLKGESFPGKPLSVSEYRADGGSGYSFRDDRYRLSLWFYDSDDRTDMAAWNADRIKEMELYDYQEDPLETENLAYKPEYSAVLNGILTLAAEWWNTQYEFLTSTHQGTITIPFTEHFEDYSVGESMINDAWLKEESLWDRIWKNDYVTSYSAVVVDDSDSGGSNALKFDINSKTIASGGGAFKLRTVFLTDYQYQRYIVSYKVRTDTEGDGVAMLGANLSQDKWHSPGTTYTEFFDTVGLSNDRLFIYFRNTDLPEGTNYRIWLDDIKISADITTDSELFSGDTDERFHLYPNPASHKVYLDIDVAGEFSVTFTDISGSPVISRKGRFTEVDVECLKPGIYIVIVEGNGHREVKKIIKR